MPIFRLIPLALAAWFVTSCASSLPAPPPSSQAPEGASGEQEGEAETRKAPHPGRLNPQVSISNLNNGSNLPPRLKRVYEMCESGNGEACWVAGGIFEASGRPDVARVLYDVSCGLGEATACYNLGVLLEHGRGVAVDQARAARYHEYACDRGFAMACNNLGLMYEEGKGVEQDEQKAARLAAKSCELDGARGCNNLGTFYRFGTGVQQDLDRAFELYEKSCRAGHRRACMRRAQRSLVEPLCKGASDYEACAFSESTRATTGKKLDALCGDGPEHDASLCLLHAMSLERGCGDWLDGQVTDAESFLGCAPRRPTSEELARANATYEYWCDHQEPVACNNLANFKRRGQGGHSADPAAAAVQYKLACELGFSLSCNDLGTFYWSQSDPAQAVRWKQRACDVNAEYCPEVVGTCLMFTEDPKACLQHQE